MRNAYICGQRPRLSRFPNVPACGTEWNIDCSTSVLQVLFILGLVVDVVGSDAFWYARREVVAADVEAHMGQADTD